MLVQSFTVVVKHEDSQEQHAVICEEGDDSKAYDLAETLKWEFPDAQIAVVKN